MPSGAGLVFMSEKLLVVYWGKSYVNNRYKGEERGACGVYVEGLCMARGEESMDDGY